MENEIFFLNMELDLKFWKIIFRPAYFRLIEEAISQIVLTKSGVDPDFRAHRRFEFDVDQLLGLCFIIKYFRILQMKFS